jgi:ComF family protein
MVEPRPVSVASADAADAPLAALRLLRATMVDLVELFAPPRCIACDEPTAESPAFCRTCLSQLERSGSLEERGVLAPYVHDGPLVSAVHRAKFGQRVAPARAMGLLLADALGELLAEIDVVIPVPLHRSRLVTRTFNQSAEICRALGKPIAFGTLVRRRATAPQATLDREARARNVEQAFALRTSKPVRGRRVLLVDDVVTTGATLAAARDAVERGGPASLRCAAVSRAVLVADR